MSAANERTSQHKSATSRLVSCGAPDVQRIESKAPFRMFTFDPGDFSDVRWPDRWSFASFGAAIVVVVYGLERDHALCDLYSAERQMGKRHQRSHEAGPFPGTAWECPPSLA